MRRIFTTITAIILLTAAMIAVTSCASRKSSLDIKQCRLPNALFLTTGQNYGNGTIASGVSLAIQTFSKSGIPVRLDNRDILFDSVKLARYSIIIALTASEYHDGDRIHSLVYMSNSEMEQLNKWINNGGILVAGANIGRYFPDGTDRARFTNGVLSAENWVLGKSFRVTLKERDLKDCFLRGRAPFDSTRHWLYPSEKSRWGMAIEEHYPDSVKILADWKSDSLVFPAITDAASGKGRAILLTSPDFLHPSNEGGMLDIGEIESFYEYAAKYCTSKMPFELTVNPWPKARPYAMCVALDAEGEIAMLENVVNLLESHGVIPEFYVNAHLDSNVRNAIIQRKFSTLSSGFDPVSNPSWDYPAFCQNILSNELFWKKQFSGYRFPNGITTFEGLHAVYEHGYGFDNSLGADNVNELKGTSVPYNIPLASSLNRDVGVKGFYKSLDLLEISPVALDDYNFFAKLINADHYPAEEMKTDAALYTAYLDNFIEHAVKPYKGVISYFGHVSNTGFNEITMSPLNETIRKALRDSAWVTTTDSIADFTKALRSMDIFCTLTKNTINISTASDDTASLRNVAFTVSKKPVSAIAENCQVEIKEIDGSWAVIVEKLGNTKIKIEM